MVQLLQDAFALGFQLTYHAKLELDSLVEEMRVGQGERFPFHGLERILKTEPASNQILGSLVTDRGHKNFAAVHTETNALSRGTLGDTRRFAAFNFFVVSRSTPRALITSYRDAGGAAFVFGVLAQMGTRVLRRAQAAAIEAAGGAALTSGERGKIEREYMGPSIVWDELLGRQEYAASLGRWKKIRSIEVCFSTLDYRPDFLPEDSSLIKETHTSLRFEQGGTVRTAVEAVKSLFRSPDMSKESAVLKVVGVDEWGVTRTVEVKPHIPSLFGELDHDDILADPTSFDTDLRKSNVIRYLQRIVHDSPAIFGGG